MIACLCQGKLSKLQVGIKIMAMIVITSLIRLLTLERSGSSL
jgi:hypothetical protein